MLRNKRKLFNDLGWPLPKPINIFARRCRPPARTLLGWHLLLGTVRRCSIQWLTQKVSSVVVRVRYAKRFFSIFVRTKYAWRVGSVSRS